MAKATTTIKQTLHYQPQHAAWFAANQCLFNQVVAFYFEVIAAHELVLALPSQDAQSEGRPSISVARHADHHEHGTALAGALWMEEHPSSIPTQLRLFSE